MISKKFLSSHYIILLSKSTRYKCYIYVLQCCHDFKKSFCKKYNIIKCSQVITYYEKVFE